MTLYHIQLTKIICVSIEAENYPTASTLATAEGESFDGAWDRAEVSALLLDTRELT